MRGQSPAPVSLRAMSDSSPTNDTPQYRYTSQLANDIEARWQEYWRTEATFEVANPVGDLGKGFENIRERKKLFVMDMFPYPSGIGLHVGHPLGYIATDVFARFMRMSGYNVVHTMGYDAFGLPAEQYAVTTGQHPRVSTERNIASMKKQLERLGLGHDPRRSISTVDTGYYRWTQWIFLQLFNSWFDAEQNKARPISELVEELDSGKRQLDDVDWSELDQIERQRQLGNFRLAYEADSPVNWCPALGTVLANEEVTNEGKSERGNFPVYRRPMRQWMMRITAYAERLLEDLDLLDWTDSMKGMQRNWIGRSNGAEVDFQVADLDEKIRIFTTRPDTLFGATYMVLAPEHELVDVLTKDVWPEHISASWKGPMHSETPRAGVEEYKAAAAGKSELERQVDTKHKSGVFTGSYAINPVNGEHIPIFVADYVLMGYGTGAIMAVPAHDERDFEFARTFHLPITAVIKPDGEWFFERRLDTSTPAKDWPEAFSGDGPLISSHNDEVSLDGLPVNDAKARICEWLESKGSGKAAIAYKLRDWLFSRQRYWGEPFPIVWDDDDVPHAIPESMLPVELPDVDDYAPKIVDADETVLPEPPLGRGGVEICRTRPR